MKKLLLAISNWRLMALSLSIVSSGLTGCNATEGRSLRDLDFGFMLIGENLYTDEWFSDQDTPRSFAILIEPSVPDGAASRASHAGAAKNDVAVIRHPLLALEVVPDGHRVDHFILPRCDSYPIQMEDLLIGTKKSVVVPAPHDPEGSELILLKIHGVEDGSEFGIPNFRIDVSVVNAPPRIF